MFSRWRFLGFAFIAPAGVMLFAHIFESWKWLQKWWMQALIFAPAIATSLITAGVFNPDWLVHSHTLFEYLGVSVLKFQNGPWFSVHYIWSSLLTLMIMIILLQSAVVDRVRRRALLFVTFGAIVGMLVDGYCVATDSPLRWLMLSTGTFAVTELAILHACRKHDLFGVLTAGRLEHAKLQENLAFQKQLLTLLTHDLSGNINQQAMLTQFLHRKIGDGHNDILDTLTSSTQASRDMLGNIMSWVKTQGEQFQPQMTFVEIHSLLSECIRTVRGTFTNRNVDIQIQAPPTPYLINCDPEMFASIFRNVLSNSIKATADGKRIFIKIIESNSKIEFFFEDEGIGMPAEQVESLSNKKSYKTSGTGYGVGLMLVHHFIELHKGTLVIKSTPNQGTLIYFSIPL